MGMKSSITSICRLSVTSLPQSQNIGRDEGSLLLIAEERTALIPVHCRKRPHPDSDMRYFLLMEDPLCGGIRLTPNEINWKCGP